jgi:uncharacterized membrane protein YbaN (DUF454 family)
MKKVLLIIIGSITLVLGVTGIILPILPTTPFLLISSYCYVRSSDRLYHWLLNHKVLGKYIYNYVEKKAIPKRAKISAVILICITMPITIILVNKLVVSIILPLIAITVIIYILSLNTLKQE